MVQLPLKKLVGHEVGRLQLNDPTRGPGRPLENGLQPFRGARRAPKKFWTLFNRSKISLPQQTFGLNIKKRGVKIPTPEIRVAPLAA